MPTPLKIMNYSPRLVQEAITKHLLIKIIKFNKYKHKKCKWITNGILKSIKTKNIIYTGFVRSHKKP